MIQANIKVKPLQRGSSRYPRLLWPVLACFPSMKLYVFKVKQCNRTGAHRNPHTYFRAQGSFKLLGTFSGVTCALLVLLTHVAKTLQSLWCYSSLFPVVCNIPNLVSSESIIKVPFILFYITRTDKSGKAENF